MRSTRTFYETALLKIVADTETKMAKIQEQATSNANTHLTAQVKELGVATTALMHALEQPAANDTGGASPGQAAVPAADQTPPHGTAKEPLPPEAMAHLKPGRRTRFANNQVWGVGSDGKPVRHE